MALDARNHTVPAGADAASRASLLNLALSVNDYVSVANATARAAKYTELTASVSAARPLIVWQQDEERFYYTTNGFWTHLASSPWSNVLNSTSYDYTVGTSTVTPTSMSATVAVPTGRRVEVSLQIPQVALAAGAGCQIQLKLGGVTVAGAWPSNPGSAALGIPVTLTGEASGAGSVTVEVTAKADNASTTQIKAIPGIAPVILRHRIV